MTDQLLAELRKMRSTRTNLGLRERPPKRRTPGAADHEMAARGGAGVQAG